MSPKAPLFWDNHIYLPQEPGTPAIEGLERHRKLGFNVAFLNLGDADYGLEPVMRMAAFARRWIRQHSDRFILLETLADIDRARREGKLAIGFNVEGLYSIGNQLDAVSLLHDIGVRWALFVYNRRNLVGSGVHDPEDEGLTAFGRDVAYEMDRVGIIKCLSHTGHRTVRDILDITTRPCIFSHSNAAALWPHARNIPDDLIRACAATGGVIGINGIALFLGPAKASAAVMADHIDHVAQLVGIDHVGIGTDYGYQAPTPANEPEPTPGVDESYFWPEGNGYGDTTRERGVISPEEVPEIFEILSRRGYGDAAVAKIKGGNMLRVARAVWPLNAAQ